MEGGRRAKQRPNGIEIGFNMTRKEFETLVIKTLEELPKDFKDKLQNVDVVVEDWT